MSEIVNLVAKLVDGSLFQTLSGHIVNGISHSFNAAGGHFSQERIAGVVTFAALLLLWYTGLMRGLLSMKKTANEVTKEAREIVRRQARLAAEAEANEKKGAAEKDGDDDADSSDDEDDNADRYDEGEEEEKDKGKDKPPTKTKKVKAPPPPFSARLRKAMQRFIDQASSPTSAELFRELTQLRVRYIILGYLVLFLEKSLRVGQALVEAQVNLLVFKELEAALRAMEGGATAAVVPAATTNSSQDASTSPDLLLLNDTSSTFFGGLPSTSILLGSDNPRIMELLTTYWLFALRLFLYSMASITLSSLSKRFFAAARSHRRTLRRRRFLRALLCQDTVFHAAFGGRLGADTLADADSVDTLLLQNMPEVANGILDISVGIVSCLYIDVKVTLVLLLSRLPQYWSILGPTSSSDKLLADFEKVKLDREISMRNGVNEAFRNIDLIHMAAAEELTVKEMQRGTQRVKEIQEQKAWPTTLASLWRQLRTSFFFELDTSYAVWRALTRDPPFTLADWTAMRSYKIKLAPYMLMTLRRSIQTAKMSFEKVEWYTKLKNRKPVIDLRMRDEKLAVAAAGAGAVAWAGEGGASSTMPVLAAGEKGGDTEEMANSRPVSVGGQVVESNDRRRAGAGIGLAGASSSAAAGAAAPMSSSSSSSSSSVLLMSRTATSLDAQEEAYPVMTQEEEHRAINGSEGVGVGVGVGGLGVSVSRRDSTYCVVSVGGVRYRRVPIGHVTFNQVDFTYPDATQQEDENDDEDGKNKKQKDKKKQQKAVDSAVGVAAGEEVAAPSSSCTSPPAADKRVLKGLSFDVPCGKLVALVGASGSGKTTIFRLLSRFFDPSSGSISLDGFDLRDYSPRTLRRCIGFVEQDPKLLPMLTIKENICFGFEPNTPLYPTQEEVESAAKMAQIHDVVMTTMPKGYETIISGGGAAISGGQKQRIAIARALVRDPAILLMDEFSSALDPPCEKAVTTAIHAAMAGRTTFLIAHRLSTVVNADVIFLLEDGKIVEQGTHKNLLLSGGKYAKFVAPQLTTGVKEEEGVLGGKGMKGKGKTGLAAIELR